VHWTANFDEVQDFEHDIRGAFGGAGLMSDDDFAAANTPLGAPKAGRSADLDALAAYVTSFSGYPASPWRNDDGLLSDAARRGRVVFVASGCTSCHGGATFQDNTRHDTGSLLATSGLGLGQPLAGVGLDTPTLLGLWHTGPWLHDGRAPTVPDALREHGGVPALSDAERDDLVAYLLQLDGRSAPADSPCELADECVRPDDDSANDESAALDSPPPPALASGCGCSGTTPAAGLPLLSLGIGLALTRRRDRHRRRRIVDVT
jgi:hypothetical protein